MDSFSSPSSSSPSSQMSTEDFMDQLKVQLAQAYAEEFLETVRGKCFDKCITKPGSSLSGGESSCISRCVDRYIEATGIISRSLFSAQRHKLIFEASVCLQNLDQCYETGVIQFKKLLLNLYKTCHDHNTLANLLRKFIIIQTGSLYKSESKTSSSVYETDTGSLFQT
ncbi:hypothetical protein QVD17_04333 [Tagetes erecta]|uniref:Tim10-like domain-containing protein n=1 Tax=Tagetes erecta TaxID=13708 RepID=A0AAD8L9X7_TARER|nr:hypothetical protein QVD17_04333 [Tagetes erecta]